jgi:cytochrome c556
MPKTKPQPHRCMTAAGCGQIHARGMQDAGTAMHRSASQFATIAKDASVTGDLRPVLAAMARINQTCVACHAGYRLH